MGYDHALNAFEGCIILVSHDAHLVELVADRLWLVGDGRVLPFDGDMADYQKWLMAKRGGASSSAKTSQRADEPADKQQSSGRQRRQNTSALRSKIRSCEKQIETLNAEKQQIERQMAAPDFYHQSNSEAIAELSRQLAGIEVRLAAFEEAWLRHQEELELLA